MPLVCLALLLQAGADAAQDLEEVVQLRQDVINQTGPLATQAANLAKYYRILTYAGPGRAGQRSGLMAWPCLALPHAAVHHQYTTWLCACGWLSEAEGLSACPKVVGSSGEPEEPALSIINQPHPRPPPPALPTPAA